MRSLFVALGTLKSAMATRQAAKLHQILFEETFVQGRIDIPSH